ncbi:DUF3093 domain-containing protein [Streptomyces sp. 7-21]|uniref:DUF3093 domain-containing protein n=1 Tax=Streptomyces sp. 7-21 TaxID=2802283 RepID=UPI00191FEAC7|nr:DUF3093 domain-containing protein [Streptomyces sp. 7-21]MBL1067086.1 DUF3093 domain-containing protein [Streptomyces sp. 7-21]
MSSTANAARTYDERLTVPRSWWAMALGGAALVAVALAPLGTAGVLAGLAAGGALCGMALSAYGSARIRVAAGSLIAGQARIPLTALGEVHVLDADEARAWRTHRADARAHMLLRAYIPTAVRVEVTDPDDPTPYLYLSTRQPARLAAALRASRPDGA